MLHTYFSRLDNLIDRMGIFKYNTIGDALIVATGYPEPNEDHAIKAFHAVRPQSEAGLHLMCRCRFHWHFGLPSLLAVPPISPHLFSSCFSFFCG